MLKKRKANETAEKSNWIKHIYTHKILWTKLIWLACKWKHLTTISAHLVHNSICIITWAKVAALITLLVGLALNKAHDTGPYEVDRGWNSAAPYIVNGNEQLSKDGAQHTQSVVVNWLLVCADVCRWVNERLAQNNIWILIDRGGGWYTKARRKHNQFRTKLINLILHMHLLAYWFWCETSYLTFTLTKAKKKLRKIQWMISLVNCAKIDDRLWFAAIFLNFAYVGLLLFLFDRIGYGGLKCGYCTKYGQNDSEIDSLPLESSDVCPVLCEFDLGKMEKNK